MSSIFVVRHAQASFGSANYDVLSERGERQAALLGEHLAAQGLAFDAVYCGSLLRQRATAEALQRPHGEAAPALQELPAFNEFDYRPVLEAYRRARHPEVELAELYRDRKLFQRFYAGAMRYWVQGHATNAVGETWVEFQQRVRAGLEQVRAAHGRNSTLAVVTSAGVIGLVMQYVLGLADEQAMRLSWSVHNTALTRLLYNEGEVSLASFNELPHLQRPELQVLVTYR